MSSSNQVHSVHTTTVSISQLTERTRKFIRFELVHAGVSVAIFFAIFLVLQPWSYKNNSGSSQTRAIWMVGLPLVFFMLDLLLALMLHFSMQNELRPKVCTRWMILQVVNLLLLTCLGIFMIWEFDFVRYSLLNLLGALLVLYLYKVYKISLMKRLVQDMTASCSPCNDINNASSNSTGGNIIFNQNSEHHNKIVNGATRTKEAEVRPTFPISVQQPEPFSSSSSQPGGNVSQESSA